MSQERLCILIPAYNEENTIVGIIENLDESGYPYLIVDDGSEDFTTILTRTYAKRTVGYSINRGKGYAVKFGVEEIGKEYDWILVADSDGQTPINKDIIEGMLSQAINYGYKIIVGNRLHNPKDMPLIRLLTNKFMSWLISLLSDNRIIDSQCGFRLIHKDVFDLDIKSDRFEFESEMLIKAGEAGMKIGNIPIPCIYHKNRVSKINPTKDIIRFIKMLWRLFMEENNE